MVSYRKTEPSLAHGVPCVRLAAVGDVTKPLIERPCARIAFLHAELGSLQAPGANPTLGRVLLRHEHHLAPCCRHGCPDQTYDARPTRVLAVRDADMPSHGLTPRTGSVRCTAAPVRSRCGLFITDTRYAVNVLSA